MKLDELPWKGLGAWRHVELHDGATLYRSVTADATYHDSGHKPVPLGTVVIFRPGAEWTVEIDPLTAECLAHDYLKNVTQEVTP